MTTELFHISFLYLTVEADLPAWRGLLRFPWGDGAAPNTEQGAGGFAGGALASPTQVLAIK